jgi:hypothetical protein
MDDNINVSLTTTKHVFATNDGSPEKLQKLNTPICTAKMHLPMPKKDEERMAKVCIDMAKEVYIDTEKMFVYIGEDHNVPESSLIEYTETSPHEYAEDFFSQWEKLKTLMLEFVVVGIDNKPIFILKGLWVDTDKWCFLKIHRGGKPSLSVLEKPVQPWGTFSTHNLEEGV